MQTKSNWKVILIISAVLVLSGVGLLLKWNLFDDPALSGRILEPNAVVSEDLAGYSRAEGVIPLPFPETFGPHNDYRTEWWYYTGNLESDDGRHFGFQLTFFRQALLPPDQRSESSSAWRSDQLYFAHFTLTDVETGQFNFSERFSRQAAGLAGAQAQPYRVWLEDWEVRQISDGTYQLTARDGSIALSLTLVDEKGPVLQGNKGLSQKGPEKGNASYYYSQTRLRSSGTVTVDGQDFEVSGWSWHDHEFSTTALSEGQIGWDWFSLQLDDGSELMLYHFRRSDGLPDPYSSGTLISPRGDTLTLNPDDFIITALDTWTSPDSGADYPSQWRIQVPSVDIDLNVTPYIPNQELLTTVIYWEGAVQVTGTYQGQPVNGFGYVELTGYFQSMKGWL